MNKLTGGIGAVLCLTLSCLFMSGCLSVPFEVAGDIVEGAFDVAGSVAEVPGDVLSHSTKSVRFSQKIEDYQYFYIDRHEIESIKAETVNGSIRVNTWPKEAIHLQAWITVKSNTYKRAEEFLECVEVCHDRDGRILRIYKSHPKRPHNIRVSVRYELTVPERMHFHATSTNGQIDIKGVNGDIYARTSNGRIQIDNTAGALEVHSTNGRIQIHANCVEREVALSTTNGGIELNFHEGNAPMRISTTNGSIHVIGPETLRGHLDIHTTNGSISCDIPMSVIQAGRRSLVGNLNGVSEPEIKLRSTNGGIRIKRISKKFSSN